MFIFILTIVFTFIIGFLCGVCFNKKCRTPEGIGTLPPHHIDLYEEVLSSDTKQREKALELKQNIAYAPINNMNLQDVGPQFMQQ